MVITNNVTIYLDRREVEPLVHAVQTDKYSRDITIALMVNDAAWAIPEAATAKISFIKPDGTGGEYDTMPDGAAAYRLQGNELTIALVPQVLTYPGKVHLVACLILAGETDEETGETAPDTELHTFAICIDVQPKPGLQVTSTNYFKIAGALADSGWDADKYLGTDENGNVVVKDAPAGTAEEDPVAAIAITEHADGSVTMVNTLESGDTETLVIGADENGDPASLTYNGVEIPFSYTVETEETEETETEVTTE